MWGMLWPVFRANSNGQAGCCIWCISSLLNDADLLNSSPKNALYTTPQWMSLKVHSLTFEFFLTSWQPPTGTTPADVKNMTKFCSLSTFHGKSMKVLLKDFLIEFAISQSKCQRSHSKSWKCCIQLIFGQWLWIISRTGKSSNVPRALLNFLLLPSTSC